MKDAMTRVFWPILAFFEQGEQPRDYRPSHRKILLGAGFLFFVLVAVTLFFGIWAGVIGALIPIVVFSAIGTVCLVVALLGSDRAVARIWGIK